MENKLLGTHVGINVNLWYEFQLSLFVASHNMQDLQAWQALFIFNTDFLSGVPFDLAVGALSFEICVIQQSLSDRKNFNCRVKFT